MSNRDIMRFCFAFLFPTVMAHAILLGGVEVPKDKFIVYLCIGHSNMAGEDPAHSDGVSIPHGWNYQWYSTKTWVLAKETPGAMQNGLSGNGSGGPSMPFIKAMAAAHPDYYFGIINDASLSSTCRGTNTGLNVSNNPADQNRFWKGATLYQQLITAVNDTKSYATFGGLICMLGLVEATRTSDTVCNRFSDDITQMVTDFRTDMGLPNLPYLESEYEDGATGIYALTKPWPAIIQAQIKLVPTKLALSATINTVGIEMIDPEHFNATNGQPEFAKRVVAMINSKSWFPPPTGTTAIAVPPFRNGKAKAALLYPLQAVQEGVEIGGVFYQITGRERRLQRTRSMPSDSSLR
jgi:hypothetical protein